jgi:hypothetical protein
VAEFLHSSTVHAPHCTTLAALSLHESRTAVNDENLRPHSDAYQLRVQELSRKDPDYQAAQVYATLSVEEALRDLAERISVALRRLR